MTLNLDIIGKKLEPVQFAYDHDSVILYALGIGTGADELEFVYEKGLKVFPTFAVVPFMPALIPFIQKANLNMRAVLHGEQKITLHKPIPKSGTLSTTAICESIYDKGDKGATVTINFITENQDGEVIFENKAVVMDRSAGNFGGDRGPKAEKFDPPDEKKPDFTLEYTTSPNQGALYRLSGDKNPLHIDPEFAKKSGFDRPILHGLCSFGYAGRAILHSVCDSDPSRLKSFSVRFMNIVYPGDTLITKGWKAESGAYIIQTTNQEGKTILGNAVAEIG
jgi:acyl dehydratase